MSKKKAVILILLILFLLPEIGDYSEYYDDNPYAQRFWNLWYQEGRWGGEWKTGEWMCFDVTPIPHYVYSYRSLFVDIRYFHDFCEEYEWWADNSISLFIGIEYWGGEDDVYYPILWIYVSDKNIFLSLLGESMI